MNVAFLWAVAIVFSNLVVAADLNVSRYACYLHH